MQTPVPIYSCPSRRGAEPKRVDLDDCETCGSPIGIVGEVESMTRGDYAVNIGDAEPDRSQLIYWPSNTPGPADLQEAREWTRLHEWPRPPDDWSGVSYQRRGVRLAEITDGLSSTIYVGEKYIDAAEYESGADWGDNEGLFSGFNNDNHRSTHPVWPYERDRRGEMSIGSFGSAHSAGHFVFSDGSVRSLSYSIDREVFRHLGSRHDGASVEIE